MNDDLKGKISKLDILAEVLGRGSAANMTPEACGIDLVEVGPMNRPVDALGVPFPNAAEYQKIPDGARRVAAAVASITASDAEMLRAEVRATAMPLHYGGLDVLQSLGDEGPNAGEIVGVVPRAWVLDHVTVDMGFVERQELRLRPTVVVATQTAIHWSAPAGEGSAWRSIPIGGPEGESVPEWSELFGRGPFASFSHEDLEMDAVEGEAGLFDIFLVEDQTIPSTMYGYEGVEPTEILIGLTREMSEAYGEVGMNKAVDAVRDGVQASLTALRERGVVSSGFVDDLFALSPSLLPLLLSGGFNVFLPLGLDPHGRSAFRYSNMVQSAAALPGSKRQRVDPAGEPMRTICGRRGATLPLFVEPTGSGAGSHLSLLLDSLRAARHRHGALAGDEAERMSGAVQVAMDESGRISLLGGPAAPRSSESDPDDVRRARRAELENAIAIPASANDDAGRLAEIEAFLRQHPDNAEAHLEKARVLRRLDVDSSLAIDAAADAVRLDPSPVKYWILALAHHDAGNADERDRLIDVGRSLWPPSGEEAYLWQRSSYFEVFWFTSIAKKLDSGEATEEEARQFQQSVRRALRLLPDTDPEQNLDLRLADLRICNKLGDSLEWFLAVCQDILREHQQAPPSQLRYVWFLYLSMMRQADETPGDAVRAAAGKSLEAAEIEEILSQ